MPGLLDVLTPSELGQLVGAVEEYMMNTSGGEGFENKSLLNIVEDIFQTPNEWESRTDEVPAFNIWAWNHDQRLFLVLIADLCVDPFETMLPRTRVKKMLPILRRLAAVNNCEEASTSGP